MEFIDIKVSTSNMQFAFISIDLYGGVLFNQHLIQFVLFY